MFICYSTTIRRPREEVEQILAWRDSGLTFAEIGARLGVTGSRASALVKKAARVAKLRSEQGEFDNSGFPLLMSIRLRNILRSYFDSFDACKLAASTKGEKWFLRLPGFGASCWRELGPYLER